MNLSLVTIMFYLTYAYSLINFIIKAIFQVLGLRVILFLYIKSDINSVYNYRSITLLRALGKLFLCLLNK